jgi:hypothetical protein
MYRKMFLHFVSLIKFVNDLASNIVPIQLKNISQLKYKWNYTQKIFKGPAWLSMARDRNVARLCLLNNEICSSFWVSFPIIN